MANPNTYDPTQKPSLHNDIGTFDDPIRKVGHDVTANFDNSDSDPTEWAGSEALETATDPGKKASAHMPKVRVRADAPDTGIDDADLTDIQVYLEDDEDEADEEDLDVDDEDEDEEVEDEDDHLIHVNGTRTKH